MTHPAFDHLTAGMHVTVPYSTEYLTWGDMREMVDLAQHYPDDEKIEWDWTAHHETNGATTEPNGVIIRRPGDIPEATSD